ncbi:MAG: hypothetical protein M3071_16295 [Actinomycetota bacterium]|nr:hypothetical protein [Actinomycetota bacterium]
MALVRHKFTLILDQDPEPFREELIAAGCGDALFRVSEDGEPFAQFYRKAPTLARAMATAVREIEETDLRVVRIAGVALPTN